MSEPAAVSGADARSANDSVANDARSAYDARRANDSEANDARSANDSEANNTRSVNDSEANDAHRAYDTRSVNNDIPLPYPLSKNSRTTLSNSSGASACTQWPAPGMVASPA